jgi:hypothetical protein
LAEKSVLMVEQVLRAKAAIVLSLTYLHFWRKVAGWRDLKTTLLCQESQGGY